VASANPGKQYDALKREPRFANAESSPLFELIHLTFHAHPTVKLWATNLVQGLAIHYNGDPLLDFGIANFLDRIAYKNPKSQDKVAKYSSGKRMAANEQPINLYDFTGTGSTNDMPETQREEEEYLYKYFKMKGPRKTLKPKKKG
jgi:CBF/Mak21 family